jgi:ribosomal RNA-processing protein 36
LAEPESESDSERDIDSDSEGEPEAHDVRGKKVEWSAKPRTDISKRLNKHA